MNQVIWLVSVVDRIKDVMVVLPLLIIMVFVEAIIVAGLHLVMEAVVDGLLLLMDGIMIMVDTVVDVVIRDLLTVVMVVALPGVTVVVHLLTWVAAAAVVTVDALLLLTTAIVAVVAPPVPMGKLHCLSLLVSIAFLLLLGLFLNLFVCSSTYDPFLL